MSPSERILPDVPPLRFWGEGAVGWYCLAGAVTKYLEYIGDAVPYATIMGVSGACWRLIWGPGTMSPDNLIMDWYGHHLAEERIADALDYGYDALDRSRDNPETEANSEAAANAWIREEIDAGRPAIAIGVAGPEECLGAGYREYGQALVVQSFFERSEAYFEARDWYQDPMFLGLHRFTKTGERQTRREMHVDSLRWAVEIADMREAGGRAAGVAAYDAWARDMLRDDLFPVDDPAALRGATMGVGDSGIILLCARKVASEYLTSMLDIVGTRAREHLQTAAHLHAKEAETFGAAHGITLWGNVHGDELVKRASRENRERLAEVILACRDHFCRAMDVIRLALRAEGVDAC